MTVGSELIEQDKVAQKFAKNYQTWRPNAEIMKSRMAFDGGFYGLALEHLNGLKEETLSQKDQAEFNYRMGESYKKHKKPPRPLYFMKKPLGSLKPKNGILERGLPYNWVISILLKINEIRQKSIFKKPLIIPNMNTKTR